MVFSAFDFVQLVCCWVQRPTWISSRECPHVSQGEHSVSRTEGSNQFYLTDHASRAVETLSAYRSFGPGAPARSAQHSNDPVSLLCILQRSIQHPNAPLDPSKKPLHLHISSSAQVSQRGDGVGCPCCPARSTCHSCPLFLSRLFEGANMVQSTRLACRGLPRTIL
jgi:hypothetical protein